MPFDNVRVISYYWFQIEVSRYHMKLNTHLYNTSESFEKTVLNNCQNVYLFFKVHIVTEWSKFGLHIYDDATNLLEFCDACLYSMKCSKQDSNLFSSVIYVSLLVLKQYSTNVCICCDVPGIWYIKPHWSI